MGRRKNDPDKVNELLNALWDLDKMNQDVFEEKYFSLSSHDRDIVGDAIDDMQNHLFDDDYDEDDDESLSVDEAALIWASNGKDEDYTFGYTEDELEDALNN